MVGPVHVLVLAAQHSTAGAEASLTPSTVTARRVPTIRRSSRSELSSASTALKGVTPSLPGVPCRQQVTDLGEQILAAGGRGLLLGQLAGLAVLIGDLDRLDDAEVQHSSDDQEGNGVRDECADVNPACLLYTSPSPRD